MVGQYGGSDVGCWWRNNGFTENWELLLLTSHWLGQHTQYYYFLIAHGGLLAGRRRQCCNSTIRVRAERGGEPRRMPVSDDDGDVGTSLDQHSTSRGLVWTWRVMNAFVGRRSWWGLVDVTAVRDSSAGWSRARVLVAHHSLMKLFAAVVLSTTWVHILLREILLTNVVATRRKRKCGQSALNVNVLADDEPATTIIVFQRRNNYNAAPNIYNEINLKSINKLNQMPNEATMILRCNNCKHATINSQESLSLSSYLPSIMIKK